MFGLLVWGFSAFIRIYLSDDKQTLVRINHHGEANLELIVIPLVIAFCTYGLINLIRIRR